MARLIESRHEDSYGSDSSVYYEDEIIDDSKEILEKAVKINLPCDSFREREDDSKSVVVWLGKGDAQLGEVC